MTSELVSPIVVQDIAERDLIKNEQNISIIVFVKDASDDTCVKEEQATYIWYPKQLKYVRILEPDATSLAIIADDCVKRLLNEHNYYYSTVPSVCKDAANVISSLVNYIKGH